MHHPLCNDFAHNLSQAIESVFIEKTNHRFTGGAGTKLATSLVGGNDCGTYVTGYLKDGTSALPTSPGDEAEARVCFLCGTLGNLDPCYYSKSIKIKKCRNFWIFKLPEAPICNAAGYCGQH